MTRTRLISDGTCPACQGPRTREVLQVMNGEEVVTERLQGIHCPGLCTEEEVEIAKVQC